jgi:hypothetical protein
MNRVFLTGDLHGDALGEMKALNSKNFHHKKELTKDDYLICLGDFGILWYNPPRKQEKYWLNWLADQPFTTLFLDGNHENFDLLDALPTQTMFGNSVGVVQKDIYHLKRGYVYDIGERSFFVMGGAESIDRGSRMPGVSWWEREMPNYYEYAKGHKSILDRKKVDYVLTHDCPTDVTEMIGFIDKYGLSRQLKMFFDQVVIEDLEFDQWFFGHYHVNETVEYVGKKFTCIYQKVLEVK